ncbi:MAG TPA: PAS domain S-box protein, partial [Cryomorphaceae bacterium]|nr:PAS domain S-box protein [Cryomorphaceae bacterium]
MRLDIQEIIHPDDRQGFKMAISEAMKNPGVSVEGHTSRVKHKDGSWRWLAAAVTNLVHDPSIGGIVDVFRDVTKQKTEELEKGLINKISEIFIQNTDKDLRACLTHVCRQIVDFDDFIFAEMWLPTFDNKKLNRTASYTKSKAGKTFNEASEKVNSLDVEEGLSDQVLKNRETVIWESGEDEWQLFKRKAAAEEAGIKSLIAIPLLHNDKLLGGLLIGTEKAKSALSLNLALFQKLESEIGSELSRKKIEIELAQIFNFTPDLICVAGFDGHFKRMNPAGLALLGYSLEEISSRPIKSFVHQEDQPQTERNQSKLYKGESPDNFENRYITKEGKIVWLNWTATSLPEQGIIYAVAKDITEEKKLRELNRQVGILAKIGSWEMSFVEDKLFWSDEVHASFETNPNTFEPTAGAALDFYREDFRQLVLSRFEKCIETGESYDIEAVIVTSGNKEKWVRSTAKAEFVDGVCVRVYGSLQDITARKESEKRLESFANNLPGVIYEYVIHPDGTDAMRNISGMVEQLWGVTTKEVLEDINLLWDQIEKGGDIKEVKRSIAKAIETKSRWISRFRIVKPTGELKTHLGSGLPSFLADGTIVFNVMILDITTQVRNEELLKEITKIARIGSWEMDLVNQEGDHMYWSPMLFEITEVDDDYTPTINGGIELHIGESRERLDRALNALITEGIEFDEEILLRTANGRERWSRAMGKSETVNEKRIRIYGSYQDIHEQKVAELKLKKSLKSLKNYKYSLDQSAIIAFTDKHGVITTANDNFCEISGYSRKELIGNTHQLINAGHHPSAFFSDLWKTITSGKVWRGEIKNKRKDGSYYWVDTTIVPFLDERKRPLQYLAIRFDITERKIAEEERNSLQTTIENSLNEIYTFHADTLVFDYANKGALRNLGYTLEELKTSTPIDIKPHYTPSSFKKLVAPLVNNEKEKIIFFTDHKRKDGSLYPVEVHLQLVEGEISKRFLAVVMDITERKEAHQHLLQANERFEKVTEATHDVIWDWDIAEQRFYRSKAIERFFGKRTPQLITEDDFWKDAFHPKDLPILQKSLKEALADPLQDRWKQEYRLFNDRGETVYVIDRGVIIRNEEGKAIRMVGAMTDITQQRISEEENRFKANLLSMIGQAAIATSLDGVVSYWNEAAETIYGWKEEEALGMSILDLTPLDTNREEAIEIINALKEGRTWMGEFEVKRKDGTHFPVRVSNSPIYDESNSLSGIIGISSDITQEVQNEELLKQYTRDLERSNEELEQFAFVASHDLQEPLRMISSFMNLLERKYEDKLDEKALQYIHFATDGAKRMKQIILDLLDYSRANRPTAGKEKVDLNEVLAEFKLLRRKLISEKSASVKSDHLPTLQTHKAAITQVLHCLLDNALKYSKQGVAPEIEIGADEK